jgi:hypothetical protein
MFGASAKVLHRYWKHRISYISVIAMIGEGPLKMRQTNKKTTPTFGAVPNSGFTIVKNPQN